MAKILIINSTTYNWDKSAPIVHELLSEQSDLSSTLTDEKSILATSAVSSYDVVLYGGGFTRREPQSDGSVNFVPEFDEAETKGLLSFVRSGKGFVGVHTVSWMIGNAFSDLLGGQTSYHAPGLREFPVEIADREHPITKDVGDFTVAEDEIYIAGYDPASIHVLARTRWEGPFRIPVAWTRSFGEGRVFYSTLGHGPSTYQNPTVQQLLVNAVRWAAGRE